MRVKVISKLLILCFVILNWFIVDNVIAAPSISLVEGDVVNLRQMIVIGDSFGLKATATPIKFDDFENYNNGDFIIGEGSNPHWINTGGESSFPEVVITKAHDGEKSIFSDFSLNSSDCSFTHARLEFPQTTDMYTSYWIYWDTSIGEDIAGNDFFKLSRFNSDEEYFGTPALKPGFYPDYGIPEGIAEVNKGRLEYQILTTDTDNGEYFMMYSNGSFHNLTHGSWHRLEMFVRLSTPPGDANSGEYEFFIDGQNIDMHVGWNQDDTITRVSDAEKSFNIFLLEMSGCRYTEEARPLMWQDDVYVDNTRARIEIGNASTWDTNTHRELQVSTSWFDSEVKFDLNLGSFSNDDKLYLYIVDHNGEFNLNGYPLTLSEEVVEKVVISDVNQDSQINITDAMLTLRNSLGLDMTGTAWKTSSTTGDVNCDNISNSTDAMLLLRYSLGLDMSETNWCE